MDVYFLFQVCFSPGEAQGISGDTSFDFLPATADETTPVYCGLFNEIISSAVSRYFGDGVQAGEPQGMDETLLITMA